MRVRLWLKRAVIHLGSPSLDSLQTVRDRRLFEVVLELRWVVGQRSEFLALEWFLEPIRERFPARNWDRMEAQEVMLLVSLEVAKIVVC